MLLGMAEAQPVGRVRPQGATGQGVDGGVERFVKHLRRGHIRMHDRQCASNLLGCAAGLQVADDLALQRGAGSHAAHRIRGDRTGLGARPGPEADICRRLEVVRGRARRRACLVVATEFARQR